ncbi:endonuclease III [Candidatus Micrarchaeota archaeon CG11_big_fil_rev_8_21_14_0_20_47_5]|nr:MAG: hypothetical protein AUJ17_04405 [Candidatus Micrarchaeota archaeon CG1_02_47_40]PIN83193.1 MAG: endonuclease III [Candidatus Micrarchaeota archaeon CG11_big_fil_rev_8_21_14_0_20_47_5]
MDLLESYRSLLKKHGKQGWWPLLETGYHPNNYAIPRTDAERFVICIGAILTQNTAWKNVEKALANLQKIKALNAKAVLLLDDATLKNAIKPAGYFNQKAKKLREFAKFYLGLEDKIPSRSEFLSIWGIGRETADSILLYAYKQPIFVVDAYTRRLFSLDADYDEIRLLFEAALPRDYRIYQEFHALIVEEGKRSRAKTK